MLLVQAPMFDSLQQAGTYTDNFLTVALCFDMLRWLHFGSCWATDEIPMPTSQPKLTTLKRFLLVKRFPV